MIGFYKEAFTSVISSFGAGCLLVFISEVKKLCK